MNKQKDKNLTERTVHYLKSPLASLQILIEVFSSNKESPMDKHGLSVIQEKVSEISFRVELYTNYLISRSVSTKLSLEFFNLKKYLKTNLRSLQVDEREKIDWEILSDKTLLKNLLDYWDKLLNSEQHRKKLFRLKYEKKTKGFLIEVRIQTQPRSNLKTDQELEKEFLFRTLQSWALSLGGKFLRKVGRNKTDYELFLPRKLNP